MQTIPYLRNPDEFVRVYIYIDNSDGKPRYLSNYCWLVQGTSPCAGDVASPCDNCWAKCNHPGKTICTDEAGQLLETNDSLSEHIAIEWVDFAHENWDVKTFIDTETISSSPTNPGELKRNVKKYQELRLKYYLRDWSLKEYDESLKIETRQAKGMAKGVHEIDPSVLELIKVKLDPEFVEAMVSAFDRKANKAYNEATEQAIKEIKDKLGLKAKN